MIGGHTADGHPLYVVGIPGVGYGNHDKRNDYAEGPESDGTTKYSDWQFLVLGYGGYLNRTRLLLGVSSGCVRSIGYFSNLVCDCLSIGWAYSEHETENGPRSWRLLQTITASFKIDVEALSVVVTRYHKHTTNTSIHYLVDVYKNA